MSMQLRTALDTATPDDLAKMVQALRDAADLADLSDAPHALLYRSLLDDLDSPALTYRTDLVAAAVAEPLATGVVVRDLRSIEAPLAYALARELGAAARIGADMQAGFKRELDNDDDTIQGDWT